MTSGEVAKAYLVALAACYSVGAFGQAHFETDVVPTIKEGWYPPTSIRMAEQGRVLIGARIDGRGRVTEAWIVRAGDPTNVAGGSSGSSRLDAAALKRIADSTFNFGDDVSRYSVSEYFVTVMFALDDPTCRKLRPYPNTVAVCVSAESIRAPVFSTPTPTTVAAR